VLALLVGGLACSGVRVDVSTDYDPAFDFGGRTTYAFLRERSAKGAPLQTLIDERVAEALRATLAGKGLKETADDGAQLLVSWHVGVEQAIEVDQIEHAYRGYARPVYGWRGMPMGTVETRVDQYAKGTIMIDVIDPATRRLVWRGAGQGRVDEDATPEERSTRIRAAVAEILETFPPVGGRGS
jgi:hypothetical protein